MIDPERARILLAAADIDLWQESDGVTTNMYDNEGFGFSDPVCDVTADANSAAADGHIRLRVTAPSARCWVLTDSGCAALADYLNRQEGASTR